MMMKRTDACHAERRFIGSAAARIFCFCMSLLMVLGSFLALGPFGIVLTASAEGSRDLLENGGSRPYLEYGDIDHTYANMQRQQINYAYVRAGETVYFGSDITNSQLGADHWPTGEVTGMDISVVDPSGTQTNYDVIENGAGHIANRNEESAGPNISPNATAGYEPLSFTATQTGIYEFHFHSETGYGIATNPSAVAPNAAWGNSPASVAAWDISVFDNEISVVRNGRVFTKCLSMNMGANLQSLKAVVYVVTTDGYIYETDFNGMDPYGFMFWGSNRGLIDTETNTSQYTSAYAGNNALSGLQNLGVAFHSPYSEDTAQDKTYRIFFDKPDPELEGVLYPTAFEPNAATDFEFIGIDGNKTVVNYGGFFKFNTENATTATVRLDLTHVTMIVDGEPVVQDRGIVELTESVYPGENMIYWNGLDGNGVPLPEGIYDNTSIGITISTHAGEYHFPFLDVENNPNGIKVTRVNKIFRHLVNAETLETTREDVTDEYEQYKYTVYYDNAHAVGAGASTIADGIDAKAGVDSSTGAMKYDKHAGDYSAIDIWTASTGELLTATLQNSIIIEDTPISVIEGKVFYDADNNGTFNLGTSDFSMPRVEVSLDYTYNTYHIDEVTGDVVAVDTTTEHLTATTDEAGKYRFFGIHSGYDPQTCTITFTRPQDFYAVTTGNVITSDLPNSQVTRGRETQTFTLGGTNAQGQIIYKPSIKMSDLGYYYTAGENSLEIVKQWMIDEKYDLNRPATIQVDIEGGYVNPAGDWVKVLSQTETLSVYESWRKTVTNQPTSILLPSGETQMLEYRIMNEKFTMLDGTQWDYNLDGSDANYPYNTTLQNVTNADGFVCTAVNAPKVSTIYITKRDGKDNSILLSGARFELYLQEPDSSRTLVDTKTTDSMGTLMFNNLISGNYYIIEVVAPDGYRANVTEQLISVDADEPNVSKTIYNTRTSSFLTINKRVDKVIPKLSTTSNTGTRFDFTVTWADNPEMHNANSETRSVTLNTGVTSYMPFEELEIPVGSYVKVTEDQTCTINKVVKDYKFYTQAPAESTLICNSSMGNVTVDSSYEVGDVFQMTEESKYTLTIKNNSDTVGNIWVQKVWVDSSGNLLDFNANARTAATLGFNDIVCTFEQSYDGGLTWSKVTHKFPDSSSETPTTLTSGEANISGNASSVFGSGTGYNNLVWLKRFGEQFWRLPTHDKDGNLILYRNRENTANLPSGYVQYTGEINYYDTYATFNNPITGETTRLNYYSYGSNRMSKPENLTDMYIINYDASNLYSVKVNKNNRDTLAPLPGAELTLYRAATQTEIDDTTIEKVSINYNGTAVSCVFMQSALTQMNTAQTEASVIFSDVIKAGIDYYVLETVAPDGYNINTNPVKVNIDETGGTASGFVDGQTTAVENDTISLTISDVENLPVYINVTKDIGGTGELTESELEYMAQHNFDLILEKSDSATGTFVPAADIEYHIYNSDGTEETAGLDYTTSASGHARIGYTQRIRYTIWDSSEDVYYRVREVANNALYIQPTWTKTTTPVSQTETAQFTYTSPVTELLTGDEWHAMTVNYVVKNNMIPSIVDDVVVVDYGKPIKIYPLDNDRLLGEAPDGIETLREKSGSDVSEGTYVITDSCQSITYTPTRFMDNIDIFEYTVDASECGFGQLSASITVIPATTVYYEDDFSDSGTDNTDSTKGIIYSGNWSTVGTSKGGIQNSGEIGIGNNYGYDSSYLGDMTYSNGSSHVAVSTAGNEATAEFTFKGTGFDIYARTSEETGIISVKVYDENGNRVWLTMDNTLFKSGILYQIPVITSPMLDYGSYSVLVTVGSPSIISPNGTFYLDAIRIHDPIDPDGALADTAFDAYYRDGELTTNVAEIRNVLLDAGELTSKGFGKGAVFVDQAEGFDVTNNITYDVATYSAIGPNNEVYLKSGQSVAFMVSTGSYIRSIQIGAKAPAGVSAEMTIGNGTKELVRAINSGTDMYYNVSDALTLNTFSALAVVTNTSTNPDSILALTTIKVELIAGMYKAGSKVPDIELLANKEIAELAVDITTDRMTVGTLGDYDGNDDINIRDVTYLQRASLDPSALTPEQLTRADVNGDGVVNIRDATAVQKYIAAIETDYPIGTLIAK